MRRRRYTCAAMHRLAHLRCPTTSLLAGAFLALLSVLVACAPATPPPGSVLVLQARGAINPVMAGYLDRYIDAGGGQATAIVVQLDTPGGLDSSMRQIIQHM